MALHLLVLICVLLPVNLAFSTTTESTSPPNPFELFNCDLYAETCSGVNGYEQYPYCVGTVVANPLTMACRMDALVAAVAGDTAQCLNAGPSGGSACPSEILKPVANFNCEEYHALCQHWNAYPDCHGTVAANPNGKMICRELHLGIFNSLPVGTRQYVSEGLCLPASSLQQFPCDQEILLPSLFDCDTYAAVCGGTSGYKAYSNCKGTAVANAGKMTCRSKYLRYALNIGGPDPDYYYSVFETPKYYYTVLGGGLPGGPQAHCIHAGPDAVGPCKDEVLDSVADFDCDRYESMCGSSPQYPDCYGTIASNPGGMTCRITALANGDCSSAGPDGTGACVSEVLAPTTFDCELYVVTCSTVPGYEAYDDCPGVVAYNGPDMTCRHKALARARDPKYGVGSAAQHCPAAGPTPTGACAQEIISAAVFDCDLYESTCKDKLGYQPYPDCQSTVEANYGGMKCRARELAFAVALISRHGWSQLSSINEDVHCFNAGPTSSNYRKKVGDPYVGTYSRDTCASELLKEVFFNCSLYISTCSGVPGFKAYSDCPAVVQTNTLSCRTRYLHKAALPGGAVDNCPYAGPDPTGPCESETLKAFDCHKYETVCGLEPNFQPYANCELTVSLAAADPQGMSCRVWALDHAAADGVGLVGWEEAQTGSTAGVSSTVWCPDAGPFSKSCAHETIREPFNCKLYALTCGGIKNYEAYTDCDDVVSKNARGMTCRIEALKKAAQPGGAEENCPQAQFYATGACASEALAPSPSQVPATHVGHVGTTSFAPQCTKSLILCFVMLFDTLG